MDRELLDEKVAILLREIEPLADFEKRKRISDFISSEIVKESSAIFIDKCELTNIESDAIGTFGALGSKTIKGERLDSRNIRTIMYFRAIIACLRRLKILNRVVDVRFDE